MKKNKTQYVCSACGFATPKWWGICPECGAGGTLQEEMRPERSVSKALKPQATHSVALGEVEDAPDERFLTGLEELDRVLGGGVVRGSLVLIGGDPGIGKSTLLLQLAANLSASKQVLYVSGEESAAQIRMRAARLSGRDLSMRFLAETSMDLVENEILQIKPALVIIDSIQTMVNQEISSAPGSVSQVREATSRLMKIAKENGISIFIVGHVTKEGALAGPRVLEHLVDTVLYFEGERHQNYRMIRAVKNRFGSTNELGIFEMTGEGLREVKNPSEVLLSENTAGLSGTALACSMEGTRPMLVEIQALVSPTSFPVPRRTATGIDLNRLHMLLAVLERKAGLKVSSQDVYVNLTGGIRIDEPSLDLGIALAVASSLTDRPLPPKTVVFGEIGLTGEIRSVSFTANRLREAARLGYTQIITPHLTDTKLLSPDLHIQQVRELKSALSTVFLQKNHL